MLLKSHILLDNTFTSYSFYQKFASKLPNISVTVILCNQNQQARLLALLLVDVGESYVAKEDELQGGKG